MHETAHEINFAGVTIAAVGTAVNDYALQFSGLLVTLLVAYWNSRAKARAAATDDYWRDRCMELYDQVAELKAELISLRSEPAAVSPPFPPGEACSDA